MVDYLDVYPGGGLKPQVLIPREDANGVWKSLEIKKCLPSEIQRTDFQAAFTMEIHWIPWRIWSCQTTCRVPDGNQPAQVYRFVGQACQNWPTFMVIMVVSPYLLMNIPICCLSIWGSSIKMALTLDDLGAGFYWKPLDVHLRIRDVMPHQTASSLFVNPDCDSFCILCILSYLCMFKGGCYNGSGFPAQIVFQ